MSRYTLTVEGPDGISLVKSVPSVTEIIEAVLAKPGLHDWYYKQGILGVAILLDRYQDKLPHDVKSLHSLMKTEGLSPYAQRDKAGSQGKAIHKAVEQLANGKDPKAYPALVDWWRGQFGGIRLGRSSILAAEQIVVSFHPLYAGTLDLVYKNDYAITLSDVKSGAVRESHAVQLELYRRAWEEQGNPKIERMSIIQVPRDGGEVAETYIPMTSELTEAASGILSVYQWSSKK